MSFLKPARLSPTLPAPSNCVLALLKHVPPAEHASVVTACLDMNYGGNIPMLYASESARRDELARLINTLTARVNRNINAYAPRAASGSSLAGVDAQNAMSAFAMLYHDHKERIAAKAKQWALNKNDVAHSDRVMCQYVNYLFS